MKKAYKAVWIDKRGRAWSVLQGNGFYGGIDADKFTQHPARYPKNGKAAVPPLGQRPYLFAFDSIQNAESFLAKEYYDDSSLKEGHLEIWECDYEPYKGMRPYVSDRDDFVLNSKPHGTLFASKIVLTRKVGRIR